MPRARSNLLIVIVLVGLGAIFLTAAQLSGPGLYSRWRAVREGMSEAQVKQLLGTPTRTGDGDCTGAGGKRVARWEYQMKLPWRTVYYRVDFDYTGPDGAPVVFRKERFVPDWDFPPWFPGQAKCRALSAQRNPQAAKQRIFQKLCGGVLLTTSSR